MAEAFEDGVDWNFPGNIPEQVGQALDQWIVDGEAPKVTIHELLLTAANTTMIPPPVFQDFRSSLEASDRVRRIRGSHPTTYEIAPATSPDCTLSPTWGAIARGIAPHSEALQAEAAAKTDTLIYAVGMLSIAHGVIATQDLRRLFANDAPEAQLTQRDCDHLTDLLKRPAIGGRFAFQYNRHEGDVFVLRQQAIHELYMQEDAGEAKLALLDKYGPKIDAAIRNGKPGKVLKATTIAYSLPDGRKHIDIVDSYLFESPDVRRVEPHSYKKVPTVGLSQHRSPRLSGPKRKTDLGIYPEGVNRGDFGSK